MPLDSPGTAIGVHTALCGVILHPVHHTRSPAMHNAAFRALGMDAVYLAFDIKPEQLENAIRGARALSVRQLAVSLPHKESIVPLLDAVDETARAIGAVNTVTAREDGALAGSNTDWLGAVRALEREIELQNRQVAVLGAGGTARAVVYGLLARGARVRVFNRDVGRAQRLAADLGAQGYGALGDYDRAPYEVLINTTSVGLRSDASPVGRLRLAPRVVMDVVYDPPQTRLLREARALGAATVEGKWMLIYQAAEQLALWSGRTAPVDVMADAFDAKET